MDLFWVNRLEDYGAGRAQYLTPHVPIEKAQRQIEVARGLLEKDGKDTTVVDVLQDAMTLLIRNAWNRGIKDAVAKLEACVGDGSYYPSVSHGIRHVRTLLPAAEQNGVPQGEIRRLKVEMEKILARTGK